MARRVLVVAAHPDDEVLGCGGTLARHVASGAVVQAIFLADGVGARGGDVAAAMATRREAAHAAADILGTLPPMFLGFPDNRMDGTPLLDVIQRVEEVAAAFGPDVVYTHHGGDLNVDHRIALQATVTAFRPLPGGGVRAIYTFEVPSSTEWGTRDTDRAFDPVRFVDIRDVLSVKIRALACYGDEVRPFPHPRSPRGVEALATVRGTVVCLEAAEAFGVVRQVVPWNAGDE